MSDPLTGTTNFSPREWDRASSGGRTPDGYRANAQRTLEMLQRFRDALGVPVVITNAWRSAEHNAEIPGAAHDSQHLTGDGVDFDVPSLSKREVATTLDSAERAGELPDYHQLIYYLTDNHYHLGAGDDRQKLVKIDSTTYGPYTGPDSLPDTVPSGAASSAVLLGLALLGVVLALLANRVKGR